MHRCSFGVNGQAEENTISDVEILVHVAPTLVLLVALGPAKKLRSAEKNWKGARREPELSKSAPLTNNNASINYCKCDECG